MKKFLSIKFILSIAGVIFLIGAAAIWWYVRTNSMPAISSFTVARGNIIGSVDIPGTVSSDNSVDLSFQEAGQIAHVYVAEGNAVVAGQILADLDASSFAAALAQANATLAAAQAKLDGLESGTRPEQLAIYQSAVSNAESALAASIQSAYVAADDAVRNQTDSLFSNPRSNNPVFTVTVDPQLQINIQSGRLAIESPLTDWYSALQSNVFSLDAISTTANSALKQVKSYLDLIALAVNDTQTSSLPQSYKTNVLTARAEVVAAINSLTVAESALTNAKGAVTLAEAGASSQDIEIQKAIVLQAQAQADSAQIAVNRTSLQAPFSGVARNITAKVGQVVAPGTPALSLINAIGLKVDAYISETDVFKVVAGNDANVTLDAYGGSTLFGAKVTTIDLAQTQVNGAPAYKVTLYFTNPDPRIRSGMTANVLIRAAEHDNVLKVPSRLVINDANEHFVLVKEGNAVLRRQVSLGIAGDDGMVEITSGLEVGDQISNF